MWEQALRLHPDKEFADIITAGVREGFQIGFDFGRLEKSKSAGQNMVSAYEHSGVVTEYLTEECRKGRVLGPFNDHPYRRYL